MSLYPDAVDSDQTLPRVDDDLSETGGEAINALRDAVFSVEGELGTNPAGSAGTVANRLNTSLDAGGNIKAAALSAVGLATLPITNAQVGSNAGILESKLSLTYSTNHLKTAIDGYGGLISSLQTLGTTNYNDLAGHVSGAIAMSGARDARHVASQIDLNVLPSDDRDLSYAATWTGLKDKDGNLRAATHVAGALLEVNDDFTNHQNSTSSAHIASAINVDTTNFDEIPVTATNLQKVIDYLDDAEVINMGEHRATQHANGIGRVARTGGFGVPDGYALNVVPATNVTTYLVHPPANAPVDDLSTGDDIVRFVPNNSGFNFDAQFSKVRVGDRIRINYGAVEASYLIDSIRFVPGSEWVVRINGVNLFESGIGKATAQIDRPFADRDTSGILAVAAANATPNSSFSTLLTGLIVGDPRGASALGLGFDANQLDSTHYKLWLEFYPTGKPTDRVVSLPAIDVTGNAGATPGKYTLERIVAATNDSFRAIGYNYRFIAYSFNGEFGIMLADSVGGVSFAIVAGNNVMGSLSTGSYTENVIGGSSLDNYDALGFGPDGSDFSGPAYQETYADATSALLSTKVISPLKKRNFVVNGQRRDTFAPTYLANSDGYWDGYISARNEVGSFTVETTYTINLDLCAANLKPGKTILVQPAVKFSNPLYADVDYGRFIIKSVIFTTPCGSSGATTQITVINSAHGTGTGLSTSGVPNLPVRLYFGAGSVDVDVQNVIDTTPGSTGYHRSHEIFINQEGFTFAHERARMPRQAEDSSIGFLGTDRFHIRNVSPKLRGYRGSNVTVFNKYVRFYVLSYNSISGEFDGYLGQPGPGVTVLRPGSIVSGYKNLPVRFYDESNVDYVELEFTDDSATGINVLSTAAPRFVDIEVFPSLRLQDENLLLGTAEINWSPAAGQAVSQIVQDQRNFGSIDEEDFTQTAIDFINAGDRHLHENGVIRGFDFDTIGNAGEIFFKGGIGLVNGNIVTGSNSSVTIPQIYPVGKTLPHDVNWIVCVNEKGLLVPILVTLLTSGAKTQFFATSNGTNSYYVPSTTFSDLIDRRKDLCPIYSISATIASITINSVLDIRRYVNDGGRNTSLVVKSDKNSGNFHSFESALNYIKTLNNTGSLIEVIVKGAFTVSSAIDLTSISNVSFKGDGALLTVTALSGFKVRTGVKFKNINFLYIPSFVSTATVTDRVNYGNACILLDQSSASVLSNIEISDCEFISTKILRPPFIGCQLNNGRTLHNVKIIKNIFSDSFGIDQAAIAIIGTNEDGDLTPDAAGLLDCEISQNLCKNKQGIYVTSTAVYSVEFDLPVTTFTSPGLRVMNTKICDNVCDTIGFMASNKSAQLSAFNKNNLDTSLIVEGNTSTFIGAIDQYGKTWYIHHTPDIVTVFGTLLSPDYAKLNFPTGNITIKNNACAFIAGASNNTADGYSCLKISGNNLLALSQNTFIDYFQSSLASKALPLKRVNAITVAGTGNDGYSCAIIEGNTTNSRKLGTSSSLEYERGIYAIQAATILNNKIAGFNFQGICILTKKRKTVPSDSVIMYNEINRDKRDLATTGGAYVVNEDVTVSSLHAGIVKHNRLDSHTIDNISDSNVFKGFGTIFWVFEENRNQIQTARITCFTGKYSIVRDGFEGILLHNSPANSATSYVYTFDATAGTMSAESALFNNTADWVFTDTVGPTLNQFEWNIPLIECIPLNAKIRKFSVTLDPIGSPVGWTTKNVRLSIESKATTGILDIYSFILSSDAATTKSLGAGGTQEMLYNHVNTPDSKCKIRIIAELKNNIVSTLSVSNLEIEYIWI